MLERDFRIDLNIVPGRRGVSWRSPVWGTPDTVALPFSNMKGLWLSLRASLVNALTVRHSFNMKSRAVLHAASLDRLKFLE